MSVDDECREAVLEQVRRGQWVPVTNENFQIMAEYIRALEGTVCKMAMDQANMRGTAGDER